MKTALYLFSLLALCAAPALVSAADVCGEYGDIDANSGVTSTDVQCAINLNLAELAGDPPPSCYLWGTDLRCADLNCDGAVNVSDVQLEITLSLGGPLSSTVDADGNGRVDACDLDYATQYGDLNKDGHIDSDDDDLLDAMIGSGDISDYAYGPNNDGADLDCDGTFDSGDASVLGRLISGSGLPASIDANDNDIHDDCE